MAAVDDSIREAEWRDLADTVLVFVCIDTLQGTHLLIWSQDGLFAAFLSAFLVYLVPQLQPSSTDVALDALIHISKQIYNTTTPAFEPTPFQVPPNVAAVNMLFFLSLALVLVDAFLAMLVKGWLHDFDRGWRKYTIAHLRAQERERRLQELKRWKLRELVALLPILIQGSLLLFCIGLLVLLFPIHFPSAILCLSAFILVVCFYGFTTYVSIVNDYAPFSSPMSRLLTRGLGILHFHVTRDARHTASATRSNNPPIPSQEQRAGVDAPHKATQPLSSNNGVAKPTQPDNSDSAEKGKVVPRSRAGIDPQTHVHVLERLVSTTVEAVESVPIFLELLDQPVKDNTLRPFDVDKWKELLQSTLGLLRDRPTFPLSAACTLARTMMICYNRESPDRQLCLTLQQYLGSRESGGQSSRLPLNHLFSSWLGLWLGQSTSYDVWRAIAFLEPSDAADSELLWMVNTSHRTIRPEIRDDAYLEFFVAVLTYISSTEQSKRSQVPLTAAVIYAMHTIRSARGVNSIDGLCILPGTVSTSETVPTTFCQVDGIDALDLWSGDCIQFVKDVLQWDCITPRHDELCIPLIAALYIDSTKQAHARSTFADLLKYTRITTVRSQYSEAYVDGKFAIYSFMAVSQKPLDQRRYPTAALYDVIEKAISDHATLQLSGLHILEIAVKHVHKTASPPSNWLTKLPFGLQVVGPVPHVRIPLVHVDPWILLHLDTLLAPETYLYSEDVKELNWTETPERVHIASARLALYDSLARAEREGAKGPQPDPELLRVFLWSKNHSVCTRAFKWCLELAPICRPGSPGAADSNRTFIPETMEYGWIEHFVNVLCPDAHGTPSWEFLKSHLVPKWAMLPSSWCWDFASAFMFPPEHPLGVHRPPPYQLLAKSIELTQVHELSKYLSFLSTILEPIQTKLTLTRLTSLENWLANVPERDENRDAHTQIGNILSARKQQLAKDAPVFLEGLPAADRQIH